MSGTQSFEGRADWLRDEVAKGQSGASRFHPDLEEMAAYTEGGLDPGRRAEIQEHLVACASCARFVLDLAEVAAEPFAATTAATPSASAARWEKLHPRLVEEGLALPQAVPAMAAMAAMAAGEARQASPSTSGWRSWTAGLAMALVASVLYNGWQWKAANEPRIAEEVVQLGITRSTPEATLIALSEKSRHQDLVLQVDASTIDPFPSLRAEILTSPEKRLIWSDTLEREGAQLTLTIPTSFLDSREYRIRLSGKTTEGWTNAGEHLIRITYPS